MSRRIDDHAFWAGGRSKGSIFPEGAKTQEHASEEGDGTITDYPDTTERIANQQRHNKAQMKKHALKVPNRY
jgi:hypothetical protein